MTRSIRKSQKKLRRKSKAGIQGGGHAQSPKYWPRELRNRDRKKDDLSETER